MHLPDEAQLAKEVVGHALHAPIDMAADAAQAMISPAPTECNLLKVVEIAPHAAIKATSATVESLTRYAVAVPFRLAGWGVQQAIKAAQRQSMPRIAQRERER